MQKHAELLRRALEIYLERPDQNKGEAVLTAVDDFNAEFKLGCAAELDRVTTETMLQLCGDATIQVGVVVLSLIDVAVSTRIAKVEMDGPQSTADAWVAMGRTPVQ